MSLSPWMGSFGKLQIGQWSSSLDHWTTLQGCTLKCCQLSTILLVGWQVGCACCCLTALAGSEQYLSKSICQAGVWFWNCLGWGYRKSLCDSLGAKLLNCSPERVTTLNQSLYFKCQEQGPSWKINRSTGRVFSVLHPSFIIIFITCLDCEAALSRAEETQAAIRLVCPLSCNPFALSLQPSYEEWMGLCRNELSTMEKSSVLEGSTSWQSQECKPGLAGGNQVHEDTHWGQAFFFAIICHRCCY